ncbi:hypothetical protein OAS39_02495 [Pirellulales bacterium]|nr:hypothetical protein [Pirellulales bacterium]
MTGAGACLAQEPARQGSSQLTPADQKTLSALIESFEAANDEQKNDVLRNFEDQFRPHFTSLLNSDLHFAASVCDLSARERKLLKAAGDAWLKVALQQYASNQHQVQNGGGAFAVIQNGNQIVRQQHGQITKDPAALMADGIRRSCEAILTPEAFATYEQEIEHRVASRRTAAAHAMIVELDRRLVLTAEQRQQLLAELLEAWNDQWSNQLPAFVHGAQFIPQIPEEIAGKILTDHQQKFYRNAAQSNRQGFFAPGIQGVQMNIQVPDFIIEIDD